MNIELLISGVEERWYRTRLIPILGKGDRTEGDGDNVVEGVMGLIMDVTELKAREQHIQTQAQEKRQLVANEAAAKEASRLKSQFLANVSVQSGGNLRVAEWRDMLRRKQMSHEIRTPITFAYYPFHICLLSLDFLPLMCLASPACPTATSRTHTDI